MRASSTIASVALVVCELWVALQSLRKQSDARTISSSSTGKPCDGCG